MTQYHYTAWEDNSTSKSNLPFVNFIITIRNDIEKSKNMISPLLVHCSAGTGRTGTFIAIDRLILQSKIFEKLNVFETVLSIRRERYLSVQTKVRIIITLNYVLH